MRRWLLVGLMTLMPTAAFAQSAGEVERCFQTPGACSQGGGGASRPPVAAPAPAAPAAPRAAPAPDYASVLNSPEPDRRKLQESLRTLDKYNGPIDGNLQSEGTMKGISDWQRSHQFAATGRLTPNEAVALNNEASKAPIRRLDPSSQAAAPPTQPASPPPRPPTTSNEDALKSLQAKLAERRKAAEPKANAAAQALVKDLKAYIAADGKGVAGEQFAAFAKWYAEGKTVGGRIGEIRPSIDDYGDAKAGAAVTTEVLFETKVGDQSGTQCMVFAWIEGTPRKDGEVFSCDDVATVEKWKTDQSLKSAWR